jgi:hypothetical protein
LAFRGEGALESAPLEMSIDEGGELGVPTGALGDVVLDVVWRQLASRLPKDISSVR